jgi:hypothetical protein
MHFLNVVPKTLPFIVITSVVVGPAEDRNAFAVHFGSRETQLSGCFFSARPVASSKTRSRARRCEISRFPQLYFIAAP